MLRIAYLKLRPWPLNLPHHFQSGWWHEGVANAEFGHQRKGFFRIEFLQPLRDDRHTVVKRWQEHVHETTRPGPIRRRPHAVARLRKEIMGEFDARQVPEQGRCA